MQSAKLPAIFNPLLLDRTPSAWKNSMSPSAQIIGLLKRYKRLLVAKAEERRARVERLEAEQARFWPGLLQALSARKQRIRDKAPRFNIIKLVGVQHERTHTGILAGLLDPMGSHGQGTLFLGQFLITIGRPPLVFLSG